LERLRKEAGELTYAVIDFTPSTVKYTSRTAVQHHEPQAASPAAVLVPSGEHSAVLPHPTQQMEDHEGVKELQAE
jgi:hypothetical protein